MTAVRLLPAILALLLLSAHFLRSGQLLLVVLPLALAGLLALRRPWVARAVQAVLALATVEWIRTLAVLAGRRAEAGEPYLRLVMILATVAALTLLAALLFERPVLRRAFGLDRQPR